MLPFKKDQNPILVELRLTLLGISEVNTKEGTVRLIMLVIYSWKDPSNSIKFI